MTRPSARLVLRTLFPLSFLVALPLPGAAQSDPNASAYSLQPGDRIEIELYTDAGVELSVVGGERTVDEGGEVFLPFVGSVKVVGMRQDELRDALRVLYEEFYAEPVLDVQVKLSIRVTGSVFSPGRYYLAPTATILDALTEAGGMQPELTGPGVANIPTDQSRVRLERDGESQVLNLRPAEATDAADRTPGERVSGGMQFEWALCLLGGTPP